MTLQPSTSQPLTSRPVTPFTWLRSAVYAVSFLLWSVFCCLGFTPLLLRRSWTKHAIKNWCRGICWLGRTVAGIGCKLEGLENLPAEACIVACQHQSSYETFRVFVDLDFPVLILKRELIRIPFIGWYMLRGGMVSVDRSSGASAMRKTMRAAKAALAEGRHVVIFPEGTRAPQGTVLPIRPGIAAMYLHCEVPVIPVALDTAYFWGKNRLLKRPGDITMRYLQPLPVGLDKDMMLAALHDSIEGAARSLPGWDPPAA